MSSLHALFPLEGEGIMINQDEFLFNRGEEMLIKEVVLHANDKTSEDKQKINKELLDIFLKKEKDLLGIQKRSYNSSKKISDTINCLNKLSEQARVALNLKKQKPNKNMIDL